MFYLNRVVDGLFLVDIVLQFVLSYHDKHFRKVREGGCRGV